MTYLIIVALSFLAAFLYRAGGSGNYPFWYREAGVMSCVTLGLLFLSSLHWVLILVAGLTYAAQTTYFKKKGTDATWKSWTLVGLAFSLCVLPIVITNNLWFGFLVRSAVVTLFTVVWSCLIGKDILEESGRGFIQVITLPLLFIGA